VFTRSVIFRVDHSNQGKVRRLYQSTDPQEVPVFGSSKARSAFIPDSLGRGVYNYAMEKCNFDVIEFLMEVELAKPRTSAVVVEFNHRFFVHLPQHTVNGATFAPNIDLPGVEDFLKRTGRWEVRYDLPGVRYFGSYESYLRYAAREKNSGNKQLSRGAVLMDMVPSKAVFANQLKARAIDIAKREAIVAKLNDPKRAVSMDERRILQALDLQLLFTADTARIRRFEELVTSRPDRPILLVYTPQHATEVAGIANYARIEQLFRDLEARHPNLHVFNYARLPLPDDHFKNSAHVNNAGARAFCAAFRQDAAQFLGPR
jgi:hypothetical protein